MKCIRFYIGLAGLVQIIIFIRIVLLENLCLYCNRRFVNKEMSFLF